MDAEQAFYRANELRECGDWVGLKRLFSAASYELKGNLVKVLAKKGVYEIPRKEASKALFHHARKSPEGRDLVRQAFKVVTLKQHHKEVERFPDQLSKLYWNHYPVTATRWSRTRPSSDRSASSHRTCSTCRSGSPSRRRPTVPGTAP